MPPDFRALAARMDTLATNRLGDRATLASGQVIAGGFASPFLGPAIGGKSGGARMGAVINADRITEPAFTVMARDVAGLNKGDAITINLPPEAGGGTYQIANFEPDGAGLVAIILGAQHDRDEDIT